MDWIELTIDTCSEGIELLETALTENGFDSFITDDQAEFEQFLENNRDYWDLVDEQVAQSLAGVSRIRLYLENDSSAPAQLEQLRMLTLSLRETYPDAALGSLAISCANVRDEDWENNWKQYYHPIPIGTSLTVVPQWLKAEAADEGRIPVLLDPGMIFGTGAHASTQMCMEQLERHIRGGESVLDLGSGSGILSITALLLGAATAVGVDVDPKAEDIARENAAINGLGADRFTAMTANIVTEPERCEELFSHTYDVVCLNIFADVIIAMAPVLPRFLARDSVLICSGILNQRLDAVRAALSDAGLRLDAPEERSDWCCLTATLGERG